MFSKNKILIIILVLALIIRVIFFIALGQNNGLSDKRIVAGDAEEYHGLALSIIKEGKFSFNGELNTKRTPLYPLFVGIIYFFFGVRPWLVLLFQIFLDTIICFLVYFLAMLIFNNKKAALFSGFLYAIEPVSIVFSLALISDVFFAFGFVCSLVLLFLAIKKERLSLFLLAGVILGLTTLIRPSTQYFPILAIFIIFLLIKRPITYKIKAVIVFLLFFELVLFPWQLRNFINFRSFNLSSIQGWILIHHNVAYTEANISHISEDEARAKLEKLTPEEENLNSIDKSKIYQKIAMEYIKSHPREYLLMSIKGTLNMYINTPKYELMTTLNLKRDTPRDEKKVFLSESFSERVKRILNTAGREYYLTPLLGLMMLFEYVLAFIGLLWLLLKKHFKILIIFCLIIAYHSALMGVVGEARYKLSVIPLYLILAGWGFVVLIDYFRRKTRQMSNKVLL